MLCEKCKNEGIIPDPGVKPPYRICNNAVYCDCIFGRVVEEAGYKSMSLELDGGNAKDIIFN